jgi:hypothetical protein
MDGAMTAVLRRWRDLSMVVLAGAVVAAHVEGRHERTRATSLEARLRATELALAAERSSRISARTMDSPRSEPVADPASTVKPAIARAPRGHPIAVKESRAMRACSAEPEGRVPSPVAVAAIDSADATPIPDAPIPDASVTRLPATVFAQLPPPESRTASALHPRLGPTPVYAVSLVAGAGANALLHYDPDRGGYADSWGTEDKWTHFALGALLAQSSMEMGVPARWSVPLTCAGAIGYEASQGYMSWRDATASCGGAITAAGFRWVLRRTSGERR